MNNNSATALLAVGNTLAFSAIFFIRTYLMINSFNHFILWTILEISAVTALGCASQKIALWFHDKYSFNHKRYVGAVCFPPIPAAFGQWFYIDYLADRVLSDSMGYGGFVLILFFFADIIVASIYFLVGEIWAGKRFKY